MFEIDWVRGIAYKGKKGFIINIEPKGLYVMVGLEKVFLTQQNSRVMEEMEVGYELV